MPPFPKASFLARLSSRIPAALRIYRTPNPNDPHSRRRTLFGRLFLVTQISVVAHLVVTRFFWIHGTIGISMLPTIDHGYNGRTPFVVVSGWYRRGKGIKVGDVVEYKHPMVEHGQGAKRVIGMPGDFVSVMTPGRTDDDYLEEPVEKAAVVREMMVRVPEGHCWLAGDNLEWSRDSRLFGPVPLALIRGRIVATLAPYRDFGPMKNTLQDVTGEHKMSQVR